MYPGGQGQYSKMSGIGLLRLHSTYRHDLKIYASDEGRVQMTAAAFAKVLNLGHLVQRCIVGNAIKWVLRALNKIKKINFMLPSLTMLRIERSKLYLAVLEVMLFRLIAKEVF